MHALALVSDRPAGALAVVSEWARHGDDVTCILLDGAVSSIRTGHADAPAITAGLAAGVVIAAESDALARRALEPGRRATGVKAVNFDEVADLVLTADRVVWL